MATRDDALRNCKVIKDKEQQERCFEEYNEVTKSCTLKFKGTQSCHDAATMFPAECLSDYPEQSAAEKKCSNASADLETACNGMPPVAVRERTKARVFFRFNHIKLNYSDAQKSCKDAGGYLASVPDAETNETMIVNSKDDNSEYWIGLNDLQKEGTFQWENGKAFRVDSFQNWAEGRL